MARLLGFNQSLHFGGDDLILIELVRAWPGPDHWTVVINRDHPGRSVYQDLLRDRAKLVLANIPADGTPKAFRPSPATLSLRRLIAGEKPDAVLISSGGFPPTPLTVRALLAARLARVPRVVLSVHSYPNLGKGARAVWRRLRASLCLRLCDTVVSVSTDCAAQVAAACGRPVRRIYNGVSPAVGPETSSALRRELGVPENAAFIGMIGHLDENKGSHVLLEAFRLLAARHPRAWLAIIGASTDPDATAPARRLAADLAADRRVRIVGYRPQAWRYHAAFDVCVVPSVKVESFSLVALAAMRHGTPVVASRLGGLPEVVSDEETGLLVAPGSAKALAGALERLLEDPALAARLGNAGRRRAKSFSPERMASDYRKELLAPSRK
jgi:glycosyltransferase involved in cell wall biosynthesis